jgi:hypothetical protein
MPIFEIATFLLAGTFLEGSAIAVGVVAAGLGIAASIGLNYAVKALSGTAAAADTTSHFSAQGTLQTGGDIPRSFNLGYSSTAGSLSYANSWGASSSGGTNTPNAYFTQVIAIADLPGGTLLEVWINGELCTLGSTAEATYGMGFPVTQYNDGADHLWIKYYDGTQTTADSFLVASVSSSDRPYPSSRVGIGVAYVICTSLVQDTLFAGFPTFKFAVSGIPLYDPSKDSTVGGSGSHVYGTPSTWGGDGDSMPAVQIYNLLRGMQYDGVWFYGLQNITAPRLPVANWIAQIAKCRATITGVSGLEATYRSGGQVTINSQLALAVEAILTACAGRLSEVGGFYKIHLGTPDGATFSFTDDNILSTEEQSFTPFFSLANSVNGIAASYPSPAQGWASTVAPPYYRTDLEILDGNRRLLANPAFDFVPYDAQVQRLMMSSVQEAQRARQHTIVLPSEYWIVEPGDIGSWTSVRNGYSSKQFRVDGIIDKGNLDVTISITEVDPSDYSWTHSLDFTPVTIGPTIFVRPTPQAIGGWTVTAYIINDSNGFPRRPAILLGWDGTQPGISGVQFEVRLQATGDVILRGRSDQYAIASCVIASDSILPITIYEVRGQFIPSSPRDTLWSSWIAVTTSNTFLTLVDFDAAVVSMLNNIEQVDAQAIQDAQNLIASIVSNQDARNWTDKQTVRTQLASTNASVTTVATAQSSSDAAFASYEVTVAASFGTITSSVTTNSTAVALLNGYAAAQYSVTLDVNGYAVGFNLLNGGSGISAATFTVDKFQIASPGVSGGAPVPIFTVANVGGSPKVGIRGDMIVDGSIIAQNILSGTITATQIAANTITANKIATGEITSASGVIGALSVSSLSIGDNAVTIPYVGTCGAVGGNTAYQSVINISASVNTAGLAGKTVSVIIAFTGTLSASGGSPWGAAIGVNGSTVGVGFSGLSSTQLNFSTTSFYSFTASGGTDTFTVNARWLGDTGATLSAGILTATVMKR